MKLALSDGAEVEDEPIPFQTRLAGVLGLSALDELKSALSDIRARAMQVRNSLYG